jgi:hypothetical protein
MQINERMRSLHDRHVADCVEKHPVEAEGNH